MTYTSSPNYGLHVSNFDSPEGPGGWDAEYQQCMSVIDTQMKTNNTLASGVSTTLTTFRQGYTTVGAAVAALAPDTSKNSGSASYTPTADITGGTSYSTLNGTSISFTASGNATLAVYTLRLPIKAQPAQPAHLHLYLDRSGTLVGEKRNISIPQGFSDDRTISFQIENPQSGTYSIKIRAYSSTYDAWLGKRGYMDGVTSDAYVPIESIMYEV